LKRILSIALLVLAASHPIFAQAKNRAAGQGKALKAPTVEAELKKLEREWFDAVVKGGAEALNAFWPTISSRSITTAVSSTRPK
jgi:hypothetical protein